MDKSSLEQWVKQMSFFFRELTRIYNKYPLCLTMVRECLFHSGCSENRIKIYMILILIFVRYIPKYLYMTFKCQSYETMEWDKGTSRLQSIPPPFSTLWQKELSKVTLTQSRLSCSPLWVLHCCPARPPCSLLQPSLSPQPSFHLVLHQTWLPREPCCHTSPFVCAVPSSGIASPMDPVLLGLENSHLLRCS